MADITPARRNVQIPETAYGAGVTENTWTKIGASINHINYYQYKHFEFGYLKALANSGSPTYNQYTAPATISNMEIFPRASQIVAVICQHNVSGSSGTTELNIEWSAANSGTWATIFSTKPAATSAIAADAQWDTTYDDATSTWVSTATISGGTVPVLSKTTFAAGDRLRCKSVSHQSGTPNGFCIQLYYRPT